ncbi:LamB/YcsF family protein [Paraburkholderia dipogonis]|uniref:5-oxoprolinase subunit A n=1 Tax=Paraburkholderia dipogonis TaxID=1211383 RepID=A0A4Y8MJ21_9BURK|nr:5-oxoprolinase subunit PxpA [Paraburkholderia dipogonis]TFE37384.1 LamB/YcsF family protein [Paraburkholderia dipogonis]
MASIDLNSDLGEGFGPWRMGDDSSMLGVVTSANIACGFHAGDPAGILDVLSEAKRQNVCVGAHVGYRDLVGFGRRPMDPTSPELIGDVIYQIGALKGLAMAVGSAVRYVKPHGALYNTITRDTRQAADVITAIQLIDPTLIFVVLAGSRLVEQARTSGLNVVCEAFADRAYNADGSLVNRRVPGAVIHDHDEVARRMVRFVEEGAITAIDGTDIELDAQSICVHGDNPAAVVTARTLRNTLLASGVELAPFAPMFEGSLHG